MTREFEKLIELLRYAVFGKKSDVPLPDDLDDVFKLALKQGVFPLVYGALDEKIRKQYDPSWDQMFFRSVLGNEQKLAVLSGVIGALKKNGIEYCILKGCTAATNYYLPEYRISGDIDLYVKPEYEAQTSKLLEKLGFDVSPRPEGKQDFKASGKGIGLVEVHVQLYGDDFSHIVLSDMFGITEDFTETRINDFLTVKALGPNDTLEFLTTHFIKHFVREGSGIRQITDLLAFVHKHRDEIDFEKYFERLERVNFKRLILNVFGIGVRYFGLEIEEYSADMIEEIMDDVEAGENFGFGEAERFGFYERFLKQKCTEDNPEEEKKLVKKKRKSIIRSVFLPTRRVLINKGYKYLEKNGIFYPVAYIHRLWDVVVAIALKRRNIKRDMNYAQKSNEVIEGRLELMKKLDIIQ